MNILITKGIGCSRVIALSRGRVLALALTVLVILPAVSLYVGYRAGSRLAPAQLSTQWQQEIGQQKAALQEARRAAQDNLDALTLKLGQMQAHVMRLDALGQRLTRMAGLDKGEFDFNEPPGQGGPEEAASMVQSKVPDFIATMDALEKQLKSREEQLDVLQTMLLTRRVHGEVTPAGWPVKHGWMSSPYGWRTDPFNGKKEFHPGIDFAGKRGSPVIAVAAGVVTIASRHHGYGNLVQINHGHGYSTRYGHNEKILVKVGQVVKKGQEIALMGSTGRSTGPHCHFEVLVNGHHINPLRFVKATPNFLTASR